LIRQDSGRLAVKDITDWFTDRFGDDSDRRITPKWIGGIIRNQLQLKTHKSNGVFVIPPTEASKRLVKALLAWLFEKFGLIDKEI
jgi:hypothetical protein